MKVTSSNPPSPPCTNMSKKKKKNYIERIYKFASVLNKLKMNNKNLTTLFYERLVCLRCFSFLLILCMFTSLFTSTVHSLDRFKLQSCFQLFATSNQTLFFTISIILHKKSPTNGVEMAIEVIKAYNVLEPLATKQTAETNLEIPTLTADRKFLQPICFKIQTGPLS